MERVAAQTKQVGPIVETGPEAREAFSRCPNTMKTFRLGGLYLGEETDYPLALESAFKMEEISYIHA